MGLLGYPSQDALIALGSLVPQQAAEGWAPCLAGRSASRVGPTGQKALLVSPARPQSTGAAADAMGTQAAANRVMPCRKGLGEARPRHQLPLGSMDKGWIPAWKFCDPLSCQDVWNFIFCGYSERQARLPEIWSPRARRPGSVGSPSAPLAGCSAGGGKTRARVQGTDRQRQGNTAGEASPFSPGPRCKTSWRHFSKILRPLPRRVGLLGFL